MAVYLQYILRMCVYSPCAYGLERCLLIRCLLIKHLNTLPLGRTTWAGIVRKDCKSITNSSGTSNHQTFTGHMMNVKLILCQALPSSFRERYTASDGKRQDC